MPRNAQVMLAASLAFFFVTATTFTSLGYVLYTMVAELGWSKAAAGLSFSLLGLACGIASPLPPILMKTIGTRLTMFTGCIVLATGFLIASMISDLNFFFVATTLMGIGFTLAAPSPPVYLLATWFPRTSARMIGFYFMIGSSGGIAGPLIVGTIVGLTGDWRLHWLVMAICSTLVGIVCLICVRDAVKVESVDQVKGIDGEKPKAAATWTVRKALMTRSFVILAVIMTIVQLVVTSTHSILVAHIASLGEGAAPGAIAMSLLAFAGTGAKGVTGAVCERYDPRLILIGGLVLQAAAMLLLWSTPVVLIACAAAVLFGTGWGMAWLSAHVLILRYFGAALAGDMTAMATTATTLAVLGPVGAGSVADATGTYTPALLAFSILLAAGAAFAVLFLRAPVGSADEETGEDENEATGETKAVGELVPAE
ncbi:CynX/NimT family MFS transporter [Novosphingobium mangrovi (ex Huang et al. 2023)]|uniref:MFS transporter n=1 Tax=Novosphingobium mangrovi (ex Huang et al. 2023) TaxID=2976432 RepID=A0ABT2I6K9_9SPHN|nr:MFS transporter [Novosphingobium mangrovi (ex Huang et al. 2023)]MCT2400440.1 MFS transporter [Novosphingobium mangrovi (ex Huang et al. 2023)]